MVLYKNLKNLSIGHEPISLNLAYYINVDLNIFKITINFIYLSVWTEDIYICVFCKCPAWTKDACMGFSIFPNTYAEVILLRLCEININALLTAVNKCQ